MPDISMCSGIDCPLKETCYRYTAQPNPLWQSWVTDVHYDHEKQTCGWHYPLIEKKEKK